MMWNTIKLKDICKITSGGTPSRKNPNYYQNGNIPWIKTGDLKRKYLLQASEYITEEGLKNSSAKEFPPGTILIAMYGATIGNCSILDIKATTNQACAAILPNDKTVSEYLYYYFMHIKDSLIKKGVGGAQPNISATILKNTDITLPPIETQKKVAETLDKAQELIDKRKEQIEKLDEFLQSVFYDMFGDIFTNSKGWLVKPLGDIALIKMGQSPKGDSYNKTGIGKALLNGPTEFGIKYPVEKQWTTEPKVMCEKNDILFCVRGATAGRMNFSDKQYCIGRGLAVIRPKQGVSSYFIYLILKNLYSFFQSTSDGSTFINIGKDRLARIPIPIVDTKLQNKFVEIVEKAEAQKELMQKSLTEMENNFNSIMQKSFKGDLFN